MNESTTRKTREVFISHGEQPKTHAIIHPHWGHIDTIAVQGTETPEELAAFEQAALERLGLPAVPPTEEPPQESAVSSQESADQKPATSNEEPAPTAPENPAD